MLKENHLIRKIEYPELLCIIDEIHNEGIKTSMDFNYYGYFVNNNLIGIGGYSIDEAGKAILRNDYIKAEFRDQGI